MTNAILSIVLFCRNCETTLDTALRSVVSQQRDVELLVLDGGSTDRSIEIIRRYESHIEFWRSFPDGSSTNAINEGVQRATGSVIGLLAGDDWYEPESLGKVIQRFQEDPAMDVLSCGTRFAYFDERGKFLRERKFVDKEELAFDLPHLFRNPLTCGRFVRRAAYTRLGGYSTTYKNSDDLDFLVRLYLSRPKAGVHPDLTYTYRAHSGSRTLGGDPGVILAMARDNMTIAETYLRQEASLEDKGALLTLHGKSAARAAWHSLRRGDMVNAVSYGLRAWSRNALWPMKVLYWAALSIGPRA